jgi:hypothetical protein
VRDAHERCLDLRGEELRDRAVERAALLDGEVHEALRPEPLRRLGQLVRLAPGGAAHAGRDDGLHAAASRQRLVEHPEAAGRLARRIAQRRRQVDQLHAEPEVGLVGPEPLHRLVVREPRERRLADRPLRRRRPRDLEDRLLDEVHDRGLVDEAHLEVELRELRLAVAAQVLVAVAAGDLEVAVDAGDHQQLLELLRALRQRVDAARLEPRRDDEVARALGRALDERRRLDLDEAARVVASRIAWTRRLRRSRASLHRLAADVEIPVLQTQALVDRLVRLVDVEGRRLRLGQDVDLVACSSISPSASVVLRPREARRDLAGVRSRRTRAHPTRDLVCCRGVRLVDDDLVMPCRSRRSRKINWPWSRRRWTQPARRAWCPHPTPGAGRTLWVR